MALTNKQRVFIREYLRDFNATQAALRSGYSERSAYAIGSRLLKNVEVAAAIEEKVMPAEEVKLGLTEIARGDISDLMDITPAGFTFRLLLTDENGNRYVNPNTKLIKKIRQKVTTSLSKNNDGEDREIIETEIELYSRHEALRDMGKHYKMFTDKVEQENSGEVLFRIVNDTRNSDPNTSGA